MADDPRTGKVLQGRYKLGGRLAEGGMGVIYAAERVGIGRPVVVKFLHAVLTDRPGIVDRFEREARATARLNHPNCVALVDFGIEEGAPFLCMEYVEGQTLADVLDHGALAPPRAVRIALQVLAGLAHAHERGILHRDLKPANVMIIDAVGWTDFVKILDFGLAKLLGAPEVGSGKREVTVEGIAIGTPGYMSPEQAAGVPSDRRSDVYCTGALLYHLVTGTKAFAGSDVHEVLRRHREETPAAPRAATPGAGISTELDAVIRRAMERDPTRRYQSAEDMSEALRATPEAHDVEAPKEGKRPRPPAPPPPPSDETRAEVPSSRARARKSSGGRGGWMLVAGLMLGASGAIAAALYTPLGGELLARLKPGDAPGATAPPGEPEDHAPVTKGRAKTKTTNANASATNANATNANVGTGDRVSLNDHVVIAPAPGERAAAPDLAAPADLAAARDLAPAPEHAAPNNAAAEADDADDGAGEDPRAQPPEAPGAPHREMPQVRSIADVRALIRKHDADGALAALYHLRRQKPAPSAAKSAEIAALIGHLYYDRRWWTDALREYRFALALEPRQKSNAILVGNAVHALADGKTYARARRLLTDYVGRAALPALKKAARATSSPPQLKKRAQQLIAALDTKSRR
ncbi:MAG TPA: serine/threonine-protein kinase [Polyangia bacterium]|nr:serine/threonine-protein kinase [Polyangia bacterium]